MKRVVVFRNGSIGNTLVAVPLMRALRQHEGVEHLAVVVDPVGKVLLSGLPFVDELLVYDRRGADSGVRGALALVQKLRRGRFDCAVLAKRFFRNELIAFLGGASRRIGFETPGKRPFMLTDRVPYVEGKNIVDLNLELLTPLGLKGCDDTLEIALSQTDCAPAKDFLSQEGLVGSAFIACHFGGATMAADKWPAQRYGELCNRVLEGYPHQLVLLAPGSEEEFAQQIAGAVPQAQRRRIFICSGLTLKASTALIGGAEFFLGNDSGPSHLADCVGTRSVILYGDRNDVRRQVEKWKPKGERFRAVYSREGVLSALGVDDVFEAFQAMASEPESRL